MGLKKKGKRSVPAFKDTVPCYVRLLMFFPRAQKWALRAWHNRYNKYSSFKGVVLFCRHPNHGICFSGHCQTSGGLNFLPPFWRACWLGAAFGAMAEVWGGRGGSQPSTCLFSMHCGCHAAGGAAVVFIAVPGATRPARKGPSREEMWQAAHGPLWSCNFSTQSSFYTDHSSTPYFIMLDAFHPVLHPGGKERALASRLPRCKGSAVLGCSGVSSPCSWGQPDSSLETTKSSRCCGV